MVLSGVTAIYRGDSGMTKVYQGDVQIWPHFIAELVMELQYSSGSISPRVNYPFGLNATYTSEVVGNKYYYHVTSKDPPKIVNSAFSINELYSIAMTGFTEIGNDPFDNPQYNLHTVELDDKVKRIGASAFQNGGWLHSINISNVEYLGEYVFAGSALEHIEFPDTLEVIPNYCCAFCYDISSVTFGSGVIEIGNSAFSECKAATFPALPSTIQRIGSLAFSCCSGLTSVVIPNISVIDYFTFAECKSLSSVTIPSTVTNINYSAFGQCESLASITYDGTMAEWQNISKFPGWISNAPTTVVHCTDGDVPI